MSASERKADDFRFNFGNRRLNVRFSPKRTLLPWRNFSFQGPLSAKSGQCNSLLGVVQAGLRPASAPTNAPASAAAGINGDQSENSVKDAGAVQKNRAENRFEPL